ncbi:alpha/beta fold hydrolase [Sinomicrobium sp. M5D2P9]
MKTILLSASTILLSIVLASGQTKNEPSASGYAPVNGQEIYYEIYGEGAPLILLHGAYMTIDMNWGQLIPELSEKRKVIAVEMQGHGHTADTERAFDYKSLASDVAGVLKHLNIPEADITGYSFGGTIALQTGIDYPEMIRKIIIISSTYKMEGWIPEVQEAIKTMQPDFLDQTPLKIEYEKVAPDPDHWRAFIEKFIVFDRKGYDLGAENIGKLKSPVLFVMGDNDGVDLNHVAEMYRLCGGGVSGDLEGIPKSQLAILPGKSHIGLMMDTKGVLSAIIPFLQDAPPPASFLPEPQH